MVETYFESNIYENISNKELIEKQKQVDNKLSIVYGMNADVSVLESLNKIAEIINAEIMKRLEEGTMDDDEFDDDF
jgi:hypothetical protein